jgi:hypothetical protein
VRSEDGVPPASPAQTPTPDEFDLHAHLSAFQQTGEAQ